MEQIIASVFQQNTYGLFSCQPQRSINCSKAVVEGIEWFVPEIDGNDIMRGYRRWIEKTDTKPQSDAVKTIRIRVDGQTYWLAVADDAVAQDFADACNECCENGTPVLVAPTIPEPVIEYTPQVDSDGNSTFLVPLPDVITGQKIILGGTFNGDEPTVTPDAAGYETAADVLTFANTATTGWAEYGTWSLVTHTNGQKSLKLVSNSSADTPVTSAGITAALLEQEFCNTLTNFPFTFDAVHHNGVETEVATTTVANMEELIIAVANIFADGTITKFSALKLNYKGPGVPSGFGFEGDIVEAFVAGACA
jgi:hypothetical protein